MPGRKTAGARGTPHRQTRPTLSANDQAFALAYLSNGENGTAAYLAVHPKAKETTARTEGSRTLAKPNVQAFIDQERTARWKRLQMDGDEVLARVALDARADITDCFNDDWQVLPRAQWPLSMRNSVESIERKADGSVRVKLTSKGAARRTLLEQTGKLKSPLEGGISALAKALRGDLGMEEGA
jgi:phage terminase small subunit